VLLHIYGRSLHCDGAQLPEIRRSARVRRRAWVVDAWESRRTRLIVHGQLVRTKRRRRLREVG
jgi:hypothetical protein